MNFSFETVKNVVKPGNALTPGIHDCIFKGVSANTINSKNGQTYNVMTLTVDIAGYGEFTHKFFEPTSNERTESQFGPNPSQVEVLMACIRVIMEALDPTYGPKIDSGELQFSAPTFAKLIAAVKKVTDQYIGKETKIKLVPQNNGFVDLPAFPVRITKSGKLGINYFLGEELTLTSNEVRAIENAKNARPTNMADRTTKNDLLDDMKADLENDDDDDLPF